jgi:hypothetical protein
MGMGASAATEGAEALRDARTAADLADHSSQPRSYNLTRLRLQCRRPNPNHWDAEVGLRQINRVQDNAARLQAFEFPLKRGNRPYRC